MGAGNSYSSNNLPGKGQLYRGFDSPFAPVQYRKETGQLLKEVAFLDSTFYDQNDVFFFRNAKQGVPNTKFSISNGYVKGLVHLQERR